MKTVLRLEEVQKKFPDNIEVLEINTSNKGPTKIRLDNKILIYKSGWKNVLYDVSKGCSLKGENNRSWLSDSEYEYISGYIDKNTPCVFKHKVCGKTFMIRPSSLIHTVRGYNTSSCPYCKNRKNLTLAEVQKKFPDDIEVLEINTSRKGPTKIRKDNRILIYKDGWTGILRRIRLGSALEGAKNSPMSWLTGSEYEYISGYSDSHTPCVFKHITCGKEFRIRPTVLRNSLYRHCVSCPDCKEKRLTLEEVQKKFPDNIRVLQINTANKGPTKIEYNEMTLTYKVGWSRVLYCCTMCYILRGKRGPSRLVYQLNNTEYEYVSGYRGYDLKCLFRHKVCGTLFETKFLNIMANLNKGHSSCPHCHRKSSGEYKISFLLEEAHVFYEREVRMGKTFQRFDFVVHGSSRDIYLEFDGEQHYKSVDYWGGEKTYKKIIALDRKKDQFCREHGYLLFRIPYWEYDCLEDILESILMIADDRYCVTLF